MASSSFDDCPETKKVCGIKGVMNGVKGRVFSDRFDYEENKQTISALAKHILANICSYMLEYAKKS